MKTESVNQIWHLLRTSIHKALSLLPCHLVLKPPQIPKFNEKIQLQPFGDNSKILHVEGQGTATLLEIFLQSAKKRQLWNLSFFQHNRLINGTANKQNNQMKKPYTAQRTPNLVKKLSWNSRNDGKVFVVSSNFENFNHTKKITSAFNRNHPESDNFLCCSQLRKKTRHVQSSRSQGEAVLRKTNFGSRSQPQLTKNWFNQNCQAFPTWTTEIPHASKFAGVNQHFHNCYTLVHFLFLDSFNYLPRWRRLKNFKIWYCFSINEALKPNLVFRDNPSTKTSTQMRDTSWNIKTLVYFLLPRILEKKSALLVRRTDSITSLIPGVKTRTVCKCNWAWWRLRLLVSGQYPEGRKPWWE